MKKARPFIILALFIALMSLSSLAMAAAPVQDLNLAYTVTPTPTTTPTPIPPGGGGSTVTNISQIFHHLVFPAETISEALAESLTKPPTRKYAQ